MRHLEIALASAVAVVAMTAASTASAEGVKLGLLLAYTGPLEAMAPPIGDAAKLAGEHINAQGGILGGSLEFIVGDSTCVDATAATNAADIMVNSDQITAMVGAMCSGATIAVANTVAIPAGLMMLSPTATSPAVSGVDDNDLLFRAVPSDAYQGDVMARMLLAKGIDEVAITYVNNDYGKGFADSLAAAFEANGGTVAANVGHEEGKSDYRAELGTLASSGAENLVILAYATGSGQTVLRQATESGDFLVYVGGDGMIGDSLFEGIDLSAVEGMIGTKPGTPDVPGAAVFNKLATDAGLDPTQIFSAQGYDAAFMVALAVEKNGSDSRDGLSAALRDIASAPGEVILPGEWEKAKALIAAGKDINYDGGGGAYDFDANGDIAGVIVEMSASGGSFTQVRELE
ncbi:MAG: ABC transporter substrate-binding protein [Alphaproteobacteria bacterium]